MDLFSWGMTGWLIVSGLTAGVGLPIGIPPGQQDPMLARVAPQETLFYANWAGMAEPNPQSTNATERLLADPRVRQALAQLRQQVRTQLEQSARQCEPQLLPVVGDAMGWGEVLMSRPGAAFITDVGLTGEGLRISAGMISSLGQDAERLRTTLVNYQARTFPRESQQFQAGNRTWYRVRLSRDLPPITWGVHGTYFVAGIGEGTAESILARSGNEPPDWYRDALHRVPLERRGTLAYVNVNRLIRTLNRIAGEAQTAETIRLLGLENTSAVVSSTGLDANGFVSRTQVVTQGQPTGALRLAAGQPLALEDLRPIPNKPLFGAAARIDPAAAWDTLNALGRQFNGEQMAKVRETVGVWEKRLGVSLRNDVLPALGDVWRVYTNPKEGEVAFTGLTAVISVRDRQRLEAVQQKVAAFFDSPEAQKIEVLGFPLVLMRVPAGNRTVYAFQVAAGCLPISPAWHLGDRELIVSIGRENIQQYLARNEQFQSLDRSPEVAREFQSGRAPTMISYRDPARAAQQILPLPQFLPDIACRLKDQLGIRINVLQCPTAEQTLSAIQPVVQRLKPSVGVVRRSEAGIEVVDERALPGGNPAVAGPAAFALVLPVLQTTRVMARRQQSMDRMQQVSDAILNYQKTHSHLPPPYTADAQGRPLLSWRVLVLPFLGQAELYKQFRLDEPWDSPHNRQFIERIPQVLRSPLSNAPAGRTNYLVVRGKNTLFPGNEIVNTDLIPGSPAETVLLVEANDQRAVPWTQPADFAPNPQNPMEGLTGLHLNGFLVTFADGSARFITQGTQVQTLVAFFKRNADKPIGAAPAALLATPPAATPVRQ